MQKKKTNPLQNAKIDAVNQTQLRRPNPAEKNPEMEYFLPILGRVAKILRKLPRREVVRSSPRADAIRPLLGGGGGHSCSIPQGMILDV